MTRTYSMTKGGKRVDLNGQYFRSSWEANWARYLNWLISVGEITSWKYEAKTFEFTKIKKGSRFYTPDFEVVNQDGSVEYHEIKGYNYPEGATKLKRMAKYYPDVKLILIERDEYRKVARDIRGFIPEWEYPQNSKRKILDDGYPEE